MSQLTSEQLTHAQLMRACWQNNCVAQSYSDETPEEREDRLKKALQDSAHAWAIMTGATRGDPRGGEGNRSTVARDKGLYTKKYKTTTNSPEENSINTALMNNEMAILQKMAQQSVDTTIYERVRVHINKLYAAPMQGSTFAREIVTIDAGASLLMHTAWVPFSLYGNVPVPLSANPYWIAALIDRALVILHRFAEVGLTHTDFWEANICLSYFEADIGMFRSTKSSSPVLQGSVDFTNLPMRVIDFEGSFLRSRADDFPLLTRANEWVSERFREIIKTRNRNTVANYLDGKVDLWSLGHMLQNCVNDARVYWEAIAQEAQKDDAHAFFAQSFELYDERFKDRLFYLSTFAGMLENEARPSLETTPNRWPTYQENPAFDYPHNQLRETLRTFFPLLDQSPRDDRKPLAQTTLKVWLLNPTNAPKSPKLPFKPPSPKMLAAAVLMGSVGTGVALWNPQAVAHQLEPTVTQALTQARQTGSWWATQQANWGLKLMPSIQTRAVLTSLQQDQESTKTLAQAEKSGPEWFQIRNLAARGVMQLSLLPADALQENAPLVKEQVNRLYVAQTRLTGAAQLDQSSFDSKHTPLVLTGMNVNDVLDSLHRVRSQTKAVPLAHLLWAHYAACHENDALQPSIPSALDELAQDWTRTGTPLPPSVADWSNRLRDALTKKAPTCVF